MWCDSSGDRLKKNSIFKFDRVRLGARVLCFHNFGTLGGQLKTRYDDEPFGEKWKGDLYHKRKSRWTEKKTEKTSKIVYND